MKIKIIDDDSLRRSLLEKIENLTETEVFEFVLFIVQNCTSYIGYDIEKNPSLYEAINEFTRYTREKNELKTLRNKIFLLHAQARNSEDLMKYYYRAIGHALATAHAKQHLEVALDYFVKVANALSNGDNKESTKIRLLQISFFNKD